MLIEFLRGCSGECARSIDFGVKEPESRGKSPSCFRKNRTRGGYPTEMSKKELNTDQPNPRARGRVKETFPPSRSARTNRLEKRGREL